MKLQINKQLNSVKFTKDELVSIMKSDKVNTLSHWITVDATYNDFLEYLKLGYAYRSGIKEGGNKKSDIKDVHFASFDFDKIANEDDFINNVRNGKYSDSVLVIYPTPSYDIVNHEIKYRVVHLYDKPLTVKQHETLYKYMLSDFYTNADKSCSDAGRFFYGTNGEYNDKVIFNSEVKPLDVMQLLEICDKSSSNSQLSNRVTNTSKIDDTNGNKLETKVVKLLLQKYEVESIDFIPINDLFPLFEHNLKETDNDDKRFYRKWVGSNPFSATNKSGTSFVVSMPDNPLELPYWYDRSNNVTTENGNHGGNYFEYWKTVLNVDFKAAIKSIAHHFQIDITLESKTQKFSDKLKENYNLTEVDVYKKFNKWFYDYIKCVSDSWIKSQYSIYYYFDACNTKTWVFGTKSSIWNNLIFPAFFTKTLGIEKIDKESLDDDKNVELAMLLAEIRNHFYQNIYEIVNNYGEKLNFQPRVNDNYVAFKNGYLNIKTKVFSEYVPNVYNTKAYDFDYDENVSNNGIKKLENYYKMSYNSNELYSEILLTWCKLNILRQAHRTENHLGLFGAAGTGKTSNAMIIQYLCSGFGRSANEIDFSSNNKFGTSNHIGYYSLFINEYQGGKDTALAINDATGTGKAKTVSVELKGLSSFDVEVNWAFTTVSENKPYIGSEQGGMMRRFILVGHNEELAKEGEEREKIKSLHNEFSDFTDEDNQHKLKTNSLCQSIILWVHKYEDADDLLSKWKILVNDDSIKSNAKEVAKENCIYNDFITTHLVVTNLEDDYITISSMKILIDNWNRNSSSGEKLKFSSGRYISKFRHDLTTFYDWKMNGFKSDRVGKERKTCFYGLKMLSE